MFNVFKAANGFVIETPANKGLYIYKTPEELIAGIEALLKEQSN